MHSLSTKAGSPQQTSGAGKNMHEIASVEESKVFKIPCCHNTLEGGAGVNSAGSLESFDSLEPVRDALMSSEVEGSACKRLMRLRAPYVESLS